MPELTLPERYPEFMQHVAQAVYDYMTTHKVLPHQEASQVALAAAERVRQRVGGLRSYVGKGTYYEADLRAEEIYTKFNGRNIPALALEYNLSEERIRQIVTERMLAERDARQGNLPGV